MFLLWFCACGQAEAECTKLAGLDVSPLGRKELREVINGQILKQRASSDGGSSQDTSTTYESPFAGFADPRPGEPGSLNTEVGGLCQLSVSSVQAIACGLDS